MIFRYNKDKVLENQEYKSVYDNIKRDKLYEIIRKTCNSVYLPSDVYAWIDGKDGRKLSALFTPENKQYFDEIDNIVDQKFVQYYFCKENFDLSYEDFKIIEETNIDDINMSDNELEQFIINVKQIQNNDFKIFTRNPGNIKEKILNELKFKSNQNLTKCENLKQANNDELEQFGIQNNGNANILDSGVNFKFLIKDMMYSRQRFGDTYKEQWNQPEENFAYESKSVVSNSLFSTISIDCNDFKKDKHWIVGFDEITNLVDESSADLGQTTREDGTADTDLKPGENVVHLGSLDYILKNTGAKFGNNLKFNYNEIVDVKYSNGSKIQPSYVILCASSNTNSFFSKFIQERFEVAKKVSEEFEIPIVFVNLDKIVKNEFDVVNDLINQYSKNKNEKVLIEIFNRIRMSRVNDYSKKLFDDSFIYNFIINNYNSEHNIIFNKMISNIPYFNKSLFDKKLVNCKNNISLIENSYKEIINAKSYEDVKHLINDEQLEEVSNLETSINKLKKKIIKTKKVKNNISIKENELEEVKNKLFIDVKNRVKSELLNLGIKITEEVINQNLFENLSKKILKFEEISQYVEPPIQEVVDVPSSFEIEVQNDLEEVNKEITESQTVKI